MATMRRMERNLRRNLAAGLMTGLALALLFLYQPGTRGQERETQPAPKTPRYSPAPNPQRVFRLESETQLIERMVRGSKTGDNPLNLKYEFQYPNYPTPSKETFAARQWAPLTEMVEPPYVCYH